MLAEKLTALLDYLIPPTRFILAYSGGLDSHVLLHALAAVANASQLAQLQAIHINHGLSANATHWANHCLEVCEKLRIAVKVININLNAHLGESLEAAARTERYQALAHQMSPGDYLLTAHQQDDQAETLLLQLLRGAGIKGLSAMPEVNKFARGYHLRPLLGFTRTELEKYARENQLSWIEDESNINPRFDRNYLRHQIMPILKQRWPMVSKTLARTAKHCAEAQTLLEEVADNHLALATKEETALSISYLCRMPLSQIDNVLRRWLQRMHLLAPSEAQLKRIREDLIFSKCDSCPQIFLQGSELRRYRDHLYLLPLQNAISPENLPWNDLSKPLAVPGIGTLIGKLANGHGIKAAVIAENRIVIKFRGFGERCHPAGRQGSHPLKKLFQEWGVPPWKRAKVPLIYAGDQLVAVVGYCVCEPFVAKEEEGWVVLLA